MSTSSKPIRMPHLAPLSAATWQAIAHAHRIKAAAWTQPYRARRAAGDMHPSHDFLFIYFRFAPSILENWHPGLGVGIEALKVPQGFSEKHYTREGNVLALDPSKLDDKTRKRLRWSLQLCNNIQQRPPQFSCFGMHEWAMVYQGGPEGRPRHEGKLPLRLSQAEIDSVVERRPTCCSHFDAFRFFTDSAKPLNKIQPSQEARLDNEQPGCIHTNMDLYKWAAKCMPWIGSDLLWDCFEFAIRCRIIDMRASPYDCSSLGYKAIPIETEAGRTEYEHEQRNLTQASQPLRARLIATLENVLKPLPAPVAHYGASKAIDSSLQSSGS